MSEYKVLPLEMKHKEQAVEILSKAFAADPMFCHMFQGVDAWKTIRGFFSFIFYKSILLKELLLGVEEEGRLIGIASVELPTSIKGVDILLKPAFLYRTIRLLLQVPLRSFVFINRYMKLTTTARPQKPHHYLVFIGVDPMYQGKGVGRILIDELHGMVSQDIISVGIGLDTENPQNVTLYEHLGYKLVEESTLDGITLFCMFRENL